MTNTLLNKRNLAPDSKSRLPIYDLLSTGLVPESLIRTGIRHMLGQKLRELKVNDPQLRLEKTEQFARELQTMPIALSTDKANDQHYEVPTEFFQLILGPRMKYSCCLFQEASDLSKAEEEMLELYCLRAELEDGQEILDLGCGWGSFTLFAAEKYPNAHITAVSNSSTQRAFIESRAQALGLQNIVVRTVDINVLTFEKKFDRVVSVEMLEHAKNYRRLLANVAGWLVNSGKLFVHVFSHIDYQYHFGESEDDWLARYFFTGGTMPSDALLPCFQDDLSNTKHWRVNGRHYQRTAQAWLVNMQKSESRLKEIIAQTYGPEQTTRWWVYWRMFFMACEELWGYSNGNEWIVSHYLFEKLRA